MPVSISGTIANPPITDATANSSDVANGKVFYNNDGRQTGTAKILKSIQFIPFTYTHLPDGQVYVNEILYIKKGILDQRYAIKPDENGKTYQVDRDTIKNEVRLRNVKRILGITYGKYSCNVVLKNGSHIYYDGGYQCYLYAENNKSMDIFISLRDNFLHITQGNCVDASLFKPLYLEYEEA